MKILDLTKKSVCVDIQSSVPGFLDQYIGYLTGYAGAVEYMINGEVAMIYDEQLEKMVPDKIPERYWLAFNTSDIPDIAALDFPEENITLTCSCEEHSLSCVITFDKTCCMKSVICRDLGATFVFD